MLNVLDEIGLSKPRDGRMAKQLVINHDVSTCYQTMLYLLAGSMFVTKDIEVNVYETGLKTCEPKKHWYF